MPGTPAPELERLLRKTTLELHPTLGSCWIWDGSTSELGYGHIRAADGRMAKVHRLGFKLLRGHYPEPVSDHRCSRPPCWNPDHLEGVTQLVNIRRSRGNAAKTHCPKGHPYDDENTYWVQNRQRPHLWLRKCRACVLARGGWPGRRRNRQRRSAPAR
jgi:hypothetical protein